MPTIANVFNGGIAVAISARPPLKTLSIVDTLQTSQFQDG